MKSINLLDLFSGIGGFTKGFLDAGIKIEKHYYSEIDKHAIANYKHNFKDAIYVGSVTDVRGSDLDKITIITFGSPCQDFSLAGKRQGMEGQRSSLVLQAIRLVDECQPDVFIWENVKGTFSSNNGADFWAIIKAFTDLGNYRLEWQLLNTAWVLPQNRERIYLVGHLGGRSEPRVFPFREDDFLSNAKATANQRQSQTKHCSTLTPKMRATDTYVNAPIKSGALTGGGNSGGLHSDSTIIEVGTFRTHIDHSGFRKMVNDLCPTIPARAREDGSGQPVIKVRAVLTPDRMDKRQNGRRFKEDEEPSFTLNCQDQHGVLLDKSKMRRLTEIEWERLQGFPDDWTKNGIYQIRICINLEQWKKNKTLKKTFKTTEVKKAIPRTQRYKLLGNAVTTFLVKLIAERLKRKK